MERRSFLSGVAAAATAAVAALLFLPAAAYLLSPLRRREEEGEWIDLGALESLPDATPVLVPYPVESDDGWQRRARSAPRAGVSACPCHASAFASDGSRLGGPARRGLDPLPHRIESGRLLIR